MKKFAMGIAIFMLIGLCSCSSGSKRSVIRDNPSDAMIEELRLNDVQNGKSLNTGLDRSKEYYDILVAEDTKSSLFYQTIDLDEYVSNRLKQIDLKVLYFNADIPTNDVVGFLKEMNSAEYGLNSTKLGIQFNEKENVSAALFTKLAITCSVKLPKDFEVKENDSIQLVVAYLPVYCIYNDGTQEYTKVFLVVPVYYAFTYQSTLSDYTSSMKEVQLNLVKPNEKEEVYLLPSKE